MQYLTITWNSKTFGIGTVSLRGKANHIAFEKGSGRKGIEVGWGKHLGEYKNKFLSLPDPRISRNHGFFMFEDKRFFYFDSWSKNKSKVMIDFAVYLKLTADRKYYHGIEINKSTIIILGDTNISCTPHGVPHKSISKDRKVKIEKGLFGGVAHGAKVIPEMGIFKIAKKAASRCAYCHDKIKKGERLWTCPGCKTPIHQECYDESHRCPTMGCRYGRAA